MKIHCIGDSHISMFSGQNVILGTNNWRDANPFRIFHAGPLLAYNIQDKGISNIVSSVPTTDTLLFCFGEIDCRAQIGRRITDLKDYKELIDDIVKRYMELLNSFENKNIIVWGLTPCKDEKPFENWFNEDKTRNEIFCATRGTKEERNEYKKYFNSRLELYCQQYNFKFMSIYDEVLDQPHFYMDDIHLGGGKVAEIINKKINSIK